MLNILIFSKDRACQLDALLKSLIDNMHLPSWKVFILYTGSNSEYLAGYQKLESDFSSLPLSMILEKDFKSDMLSIISSMAGEFICFMTDDDVLIKPVNSDPIFDRLKEDCNVIAISLRLGNNINRCYAGGNAYTPPPLTHNYGFPWRSNGGDWGYPMSLDGNIFNLKGMVDYLETLNFSGPNELEGVMHNSHPNKPIMLCFSDSRLINIPANRVQTIVDNRFQNSFSQKDLNDLYLDGSRIDVKKLYNLEANTCHVEVSLPIAHKND